MAAPVCVDNRKTLQPAIRLAVITEHPVVRAGLRHLLESRKTLVVTGDASKPTEAISLLASNPPDVVLFDPDGEDFTIHGVERLVGLSEARILIFTAATEPALRQQALALGAMGVVLKRHSVDTLVQAVEKVHAGEVWLERAVTGSMLRKVLRRSHDPEVLKIQSLTKRELEVIGLIGSGFKNEAVAGRLFISNATVRNHMTSILAKLELSDRFELAFFALRHGLVRDQRVSAQANPVDGTPRRLGSVGQQNFG